MTLKYYLHKVIGKLFDSPIIPYGKTVGYSFIRSERVNTSLSKDSKVNPPYFLHNVTLGDYSYIAKNASISNCFIGKFCSIGPNLCCGMGVHPTNGLSTSPMFYSTAKQNGNTLCLESKVEESKMTVIGNDVFIGANVTIIDGVRIGDGAIIGAGAVVTRDIPPYGIAMGVPARIKRFRFDQKTIERLLEKQWWNQGPEELALVEKNFFSPDVYLKK